MAILLWRVLMVIVAVAILFAVIWVITRSVNGTRRQKRTIRRLDQETDPDIADAEYRDIGEGDAGKKRDSDTTHGE